MGIPGLNTWFRRTFAEAYVDLDSVSVDHLYVDMNSVLHLVLRRARTMHQFYVLLYRKCDFILECCRPKKSVMFALDGPAPVAKLVTQRIRRKRVTLTRSDEKGKTVSPLALTPGTPFMQEIHEALAYFICQRLIGSKYKHLRMELSGSTVQGEGECKILARLQQPLAHVQQADSHALIGNDSDLLMMSLMAECRHVYVLGQILDHPGDLPKSLGKLKVFSVQQLAQPLLRHFPSLKASPDQRKHHLRTIQRDLAVALILSRGNDYLPAMGGVPLDRLEDIQDRAKREIGVWSTYLQLRNGTEHHLRSLVHMQNGKIHFDYEFFYQLLKESGLQPLARNPSEMRRPPDPHLYIDGLLWILDMYSRGICPDYRYVYGGVGPSSNELCDAILERQQSHADQGCVDQDGARLPLKPSECALALLPYQGKRYVAKPLQHLMEPDSPIGDLFQDCEECTQYSLQAARIQREIAETASQSSELTKRIDHLDADRATKLAKRLRRLSDRREQLRDQIRDLCADRTQHMQDKHPYQPFPIERIEEAVRNIPVAKFGPTDHEVFNFGQAFVFQRSSHGTQEARYGPKLSRIWKNAPEPPSEKFRRFKVPLPIVRTNVIRPDHISSPNRSTYPGRLRNPSKLRRTGSLFVRTKDTVAYTQHFLNKNNLQLGKIRVQN